MQNILDKSQKVCLTSVVLAVHVFIIVETLHCFFDEG